MPVNRFVVFNYFFFSLIVRCRGELHGFRDNDYRFSGIVKMKEKNISVTGRSSGDAVADSLFRVVVNQVTVVKVDWTQSSQQWHTHTATQFIHKHTHSLGEYA